MINNEELLELEKMIHQFIELMQEQLTVRWNSWQIKLEETEKYEVIGGLIARQVSLCRQIALSPYTWNGHIAPVILRCMVDVFISLAWIFDNPLERSRQFIEYGLGQEKLNLEHQEVIFGVKGVNVENNELIKALQQWIDSQKFHFLTEVNIGSWSSLTTREMARQTGDMDFYNFAFQPFSNAVHSTWGHIARYNLVECESPLHRYHRIPIDSNPLIDIDYFYRASKYVEKAFKLFDEKTGIDIKDDSAFEFLQNWMKGPAEG